MNAAPSAIASTFEQRITDALAAYGITWRGTIPAIGDTVRATGAGKGPTNDATAITRKAEGIVWFDYSTRKGGFVPEHGPASNLSGTELERIRTLARLQREGRKADERTRQSDAIERARRDLAAASCAVSHPYWMAKFGPDAVLPAGLLVDGRGDLLAPRRDASDRVVGYQRIGDDGAKRYSLGTPARGTFFGLGTVDPAGTVLVAEGLATGATVHAETGHPCGVVFDAGNLRSVAELLREKYPAVRIVVCADDDRQTKGNPGRQKAIEAATAIDGRVWLPELCRCCRCTDHNDRAQCRRRRGGA